MTRMMWQREWDRLRAMEQHAFRKAEAAERELALSEAPDARLERRFHTLWQVAAEAEAARVAFEAARHGPSALVMYR
jgi:hypothetical protein